MRTDGQTNRHDELTDAFAILLIHLKIISAAHRKYLMLCFIWISKQTAIIFQYKINLLVPCTENKCVSESCEMNIYIYIYIYKLYFLP